MAKLHPQTKKLIKHVNTLKDNGKDVKFYEFETLYDMPAKRYSRLNEFIEDRSRGLDRSELKDNIEECMNSIESNTTKGITDAVIILRWMRQRMEIAYDLDLIMRLISCAIFTLDEDIFDYDYDIGTHKMKLFEENGLDAFFLTESIKRWWTATDISESDMELLIEQRNYKRQLYKELKAMSVPLTDSYTEKSII
jgi:hypothetical protein